VLITSSARLHQLDEKPAEAVTVDVGGVQMGISVSASAHGKCVRCWHHREDVGATSAHPELCGRCIDNVEGAGEQRKYA
jgi:isoleucyl-tRNA synthetase